MTQEQASLAYLAFDDTDTKESPMGTGKLMRTFCYKLPDTYSLCGVLRHQHPKHDDIPFTSNNSSACALIEIHEKGSLEDLVEKGTNHLLENFVEGSDPGLCAALATDVHDELVHYGMKASATKVRQKDALRAVNGFTLRGLGGTNDGIIGAAAAVGLSKHGWCGRFIEYGRLRDLCEPLTVGQVQATGIRVLSTDRDPLVPQPEDELIANGWIRPSLWAGHPVLQVNRQSNGTNNAWVVTHKKNRKK